MRDSRRALAGKRLAWMAPVSLLGELLTSALAGSTTPTPGTPNQQAVDARAVQALIAQLGHEAYEKREEAQKRLAMLGEPILDLLQRATTEHPDAEVRERADQLSAAIEQRLFQQLARIRHDAAGNRIALTPDSLHFVAVGTGPVSMGRIDLAGPLRKLPTKGNQWTVAVSANGKRVISAGEDRVAHVYDLETGQPVQELIGHEEAIWAAALFPDGKRAITGGKDNSLRLWDVETGKQVGAFTGIKEDVRCLALSPDCKTVAVGHLQKGYDPPGTIRLWDVETLRERCELVGHTLEVGQVVFSADGKRLLSAGFDNTVRLWDVASGKELKRFMCKSKAECVAFADGERRFLCSANPVDPTLQLWDIEQGKRLLRSAPIPPGFLGVVAQPGGGRALSVGRDGMVRLWQWKK
jgi:WD40 repeat protein